MLSISKPVYIKKKIGVSPKRTHRIMLSPRNGPLPNRPVKKMSPIKSQSTSTSSRKTRSTSSRKTRSTSSHKPKSTSSRKTKSTSSHNLQSLPFSNASPINSSYTRRRGRRGQRHINYEKHKIYKSRIKLSKCRKITPRSKCNQLQLCKYAMGNIRQFCRKKNNTRVINYRD